MNHLSLCLEKNNEMKSLLYVLMMVLAVGMHSCKDGDATTSSAPKAATTVDPVVNNTTTQPSPSAISGVEHYTCPNGHAGSGGDAAGTCSQCGATLEHNAAFHDTQPDANATSPDLTAAEAEYNQQNTNPNVEHYTCPNGHVGSGAAEAGTCSQCGATLEHNAAFHNDAPPADLTNQLNNISPETAVSSVPSSGGVEHYICPNGHAGSGGAAEGTCSQCGATLSHNDAFHNSPVDAGNTGSPTAAPTEQIRPQPSGAISPVFQNAGGAPGLGGVGAGAAGAGQLPEPAQNGAGVWHYVCPDGHAGGAGSASGCSQCGKTLIHNTAYHN